MTAKDIMASPPTGAARAKGRPSTAEAQAIGRAVRDAAMQVLLEQGDAATMNAVAQRAGISRKSLYARYPGRSELFAAVIRSLLDDAGPVEVEEGIGFADCLMRYVGKVVRTLEDPHSRAVQRLLSIDTYYVRSLHDELQDASDRMFLFPLRDLIAAAQQCGEIGGSDPEGLARLILGMIFASRMMQRRNAESAVSADALSRLILYGLLPRPPE